MYKLANGSALSRTMFANLPPSAHMPASDVKAEVRPTVGADMAPRLTCDIATFALAEAPCCSTA